MGVNVVPSSGVSEPKHVENCRVYENKRPGPVPKFDVRAFDGTIVVAMNASMADALITFIRETELDNDESYLWALQAKLIQALRF